MKTVTAFTYSASVVKAILTALELSDTANKMKLEAVSTKAERKAVSKAHCVAIQAHYKAAELVTAWHHEKVHAHSDASNEAEFDIKSYKFTGTKAKTKK